MAQALTWVFKKLSTRERASVAENQASESIKMFRYILEFSRVILGGQQDDDVVKC